jgi:hypothetical protein
MFYMFRVSLSPIFRSTNNCIYSIWHLSHRYCYLPLSWKSWNRFECVIVVVEVVELAVVVLELAVVVVEVAVVVVEVAVIVV